MEKWHLLEVGTQSLLTVHRCVPVWVILCTTLGDKDEWKDSVTAFKNFKTISTELGCDECDMFQKERLKQVSSSNHEYQSCQSKFQVTCLRRSRWVHYIWATGAIVIWKVQIFGSFQKAFRILHKQIMSVVIIIVRLASVVSNFYVSDTSRMFMDEMYLTEK